MKKNIDPRHKPREISPLQSMAGILKNAHVSMRHDAFKAGKPVVITVKQENLFLFADGHTEPVNIETISRYLA